MTGRRGGKLREATLFDGALRPVPQPAGNHGRRQQGRTQNACPEAELTGKVAHVFAGDEVIDGPPDERSENEEKHQDGGDGNGANALAAGLLVP